ncbi:prolipoprotein diacylglyceryl transferase family protein [Actinoplanes sp. NPDC049548]|uniref:prolipoprotein diacylglyceryl transferase family protein n=1 Tax=Actinoplanes sp. NPDC049548 TaxID=3155152 RepID=UPI003415629F
MYIGRTAAILHGALVGVGLIVGGLVLAAELRRRGRSDFRFWYLVAGALVGGALLERLGTWLRHLTPGANPGLAEQWLYGSRSILSALVGAYAGVLVAKRLCRYESPTGDLFAPAIAAGMAVGRIGCLLTERPGTPTGGRWGVTLSTAQAAAVPGAPAGVPLHPSFAYEILFHLVALVVLLCLRDRVTVPDALFTGYLAAYAIFRFGVEFVRGNEVVAAGLTRPQLFLLACSPLLAWRVWRVRGERRVPAGVA